MAACMHEVSRAKCSALMDVHLLPKGGEEITSPLQCTGSLGLGNQLRRVVCSMPQCDMSGQHLTEFGDLRINKIPPYVGSITTSHFGNVSERFQNCCSSSRT